MSEKRFCIDEKTNYKDYPIILDTKTGDWWVIQDTMMGTGKLLDLLNEQQATISKLQDLCGESDGENAKLRIENKRLQDEIKLLKPTNVEQYEQIVQLQEENEQLKKQIQIYEQLISNSYVGEEETLDGFVGKYVIWEDELQKYKEKIKNVIDDELNDCCKIMNEQQDTITELESDKAIAEDYANIFEKENVKLRKKLNNYKATVLGFLWIMEENGRISGKDDDFVKDLFKLINDE